MVSGTSSFQIYLEPDIPKSLFDLLEDEESWTIGKDELSIQIKVKHVSIDPEESMSNEEMKGEEPIKDSDLSTLYLVRYNGWNDSNFDELEDILLTLNKVKEPENLEEEKKEDKDKTSSDSDDEFQEYILVNLGTKPPLTSQCKMDLTFTRETDEDVQLVVRGSRGMFITGNYILN